MNNREIFKVWAPSNAKWIDWVRPVLFITINNMINSSAICNFKVPDINYLNALPKNTAIIVDLPDTSSVEEGIALAKLGFRPIPLYNGNLEQEGAIPIIDNHIIQAALKWGTSELNKLKIKIDAPPAFLLDSNRMHRHRVSTSIFDNSWDLYDQDIPSPEYFLNNNINKIVVRGEKIHRDLAKILYKFQKKGIIISLTDGYTEPKEVLIKKPKKKNM